MEPPKFLSGQNKESEVQSRNCKNFMFQDVTRVNSYENFHSSEGGVQSEFAADNRRLRSGYQMNQSLNSKVSTKNDMLGNNKYTQAVEKASRQLRNNFVNDCLNQLKTVATQPPSYTLSNNQDNVMIRPVSQSRLNNALRLSVQNVQKHIKLRSAERRPGKGFIQNTVFTDNTRQFQPQSFTSKGVNNETQKEIISSERPQLENNIDQNQETRNPYSSLNHKTQRVQMQRSNFIEKVLIQDTLTTRKQQENIQTTTVSEITQSKETIGRKLNLKETEPQLLIQQPEASNVYDNLTDEKLQNENSKTQIHDKTQFNQQFIQKIGPFEIYVPPIPTDTTYQDVQDQLMLKFIGFIRKGYLNQAEAALNAVNKNSLIYTFNLGLLKLLQNKPQEAFQVLQEQFSSSNNAIIAQAEIEKLKVQNFKNSNGTYNRNSFTKSVPITQVKRQYDYTEKTEKLVPSDWDLFLFQVKKYRKDEMHKFIEDKIYFDKVLAKTNYIQEDKQTLIPNFVTNIIQTPSVNSKRKEPVISVTQVRNQECTEQLVVAADKSLEEIFIELINIQATYCVGAKDPIKESYHALVEGLRMFNEVSKIEVFVKDFIEQAKKCDREAIISLLSRYQIPDKHYLRARTFIISCLNVENDEQNDIALNYLLNIVSHAEQDKLKRMLDPERFQIESVFNNLIQDIISASRHEYGAVPLKEEDQHWVDRLNFHKELSGRSLENFLTRILNRTKQEFNQYLMASKFIERPESFNRIEAGRCPKAIRLQIQKKAQKAWEDHIKKPLCQEELELVTKKVQEEIKEIEIEARFRFEANKEYLLQLQQEKNRQAKNKGMLFIEEKKITKKQGMKYLFEDFVKHKFFEETDKVIKQRKEEEEEDQINLLNQDDDQVSNKEVSEDDLEDKKLQKEVVFNSEHMQIESQPEISSEKTVNLWSDHPNYEKLKKTLYEIQIMCTDEQVIFKRDQKKLAPLLEKWGIEAEAQREQFELNNPQAHDFSSQNVQRPRIGHQISEQLFSYFVKSLSNLDNLFHSELTKLDQKLTENFRFFSIIDKNVRLAIYKSCELVHYEKNETLIEADVDETNYVYIVLKGKVDYKMYKSQTLMTLTAATYCSGEVFGDASIQRQFFDVLKCLSKDRNYLQTATDDVYALRIPKESFISAIFTEMRAELMFKILLFRNTPYFQELSPYSLIMFASICEVKEYKYGEIIISQGEKPNACYLLAQGRCQAIYQYVEQQKIESIGNGVNLNQGTLKHNFQIGKIDYLKYPSQTARQQPEINSTLKSKSQKKKQIPSKITYRKPSFQQELSGSPKFETKQNMINEEFQADADQDNQMKRAYFHSILSKDDNKNIIQYENHIVFGDVNSGQVFCARTLLDHTTFNKQIQTNSIRFSEQLGINSDEFFEYNKQQEILKIGQQKQSQKIARKNTSFCKQCFEEKKEKCDCHNTQQINKEQPNTEIEEILDFTQDIEIEDSEKEEQEQISPTLTRKFDQSDIKESLEELSHRQFIDHMQDSLMRSQASILVMSAIAKLIVIRREDKTFLNESLKQAIDKAILEQDFRDFDRPLDNFKELQKQVEKTRDWIQDRKKIEKSILREARTTRK